MLFLLTQQLSLKKSLKSVLLKIYGINQTLATLIISDLGLVLDIKIKDVLPEGLNKVNPFIYKRIKLLEQPLRYFEEQAIDLYFKTGTYKSFRFIQGLPVNGQRTHSNAGTAKHFRHKRALITRKIKKK